ncbi:MAG: matrixin family metalloprotease [Magnetococcales bacterium]|nr:matrixin family metalloprotease [Magnetococcales bacterium]
MLANIWCVLFFLMALSGFSVPSAVAGYVTTETYVQPYLGISDPFGRWNGAIAWVYNPTNAQTLFSDKDRMVVLLKEAMAEWEGVSGVKFSYQGINSTAKMDNDADQLVVVAWGNASGAAAKAGPSRSYSTGSDRSLGYDPYTDGSVVISDTYDWTENGQLTQSLSEKLLKKVLVHEVGHLIGLGHSDNPVSIMYANPYNNIGHLMPDDIAAAQDMYGLPTTAVTVPVYVPPTTTKTIFSSSLLYLQSSGDKVAVTSITDATADSDTLYLKLQFKGPFTQDVQIVVTDPSGYAIQEIAATLTCSVNNICTRSYGVGYLDILKSISGSYHAYVVADNQLVADHAVTVATNLTWNRPPVASLALTATSGTAPLSVGGTVTATDPENNTIAVTWHIPGQGAVVQSNFSGSATRTITFDTPGQYELFVAVSDNGSRYTGTSKNSPASSAGEGVRKVLRQTITVTTASAFTLDIDGNGKYDPLTDGVLVMRYLLGMTGSALTSGAVASTGSRTGDAAILAYLDTAKTVLDVDGDGKITAQTDGLLILRRLFGFSGAALTSGVVDAAKSDAVIQAIKAIIP